MIIKKLQTLNLEFGQVMFNSNVFSWKRNIEVTFGIFSVSVSHKKIFLKVLYISIFSKLVIIKNLKIVIL